MGTEWRSRKGVLIRNFALLRIIKTFCSFAGEESRGYKEEEKNRCDSLSGYFVR